MLRGSPILRLISRFRCTLFKISKTLEASDGSPPPTPDPLIIPNMFNPLPLEPKWTPDRGLKYKWYNTGIRGCRFMVKMIHLLTTTSQNRIVYIFSFIFSSEGELFIPPFDYKMPHITLHVFMDMELELAAAFGIKHIGFGIRNI